MEKKTSEAQQRGPGAEKVELEKRLDSNAKVEEAAKKQDPLAKPSKSKG